MSEPAPAPTLFLIGASHHTAPIELREKLALGTDKLPALASRLRAVTGLREFAVLNTCNRVEVYGVAETPATLDALQDALCEVHTVPRAAYAAIRTRSSAAATIAHLIEVSSGLDSQMLGENEIFGHVKDAYAAAQAAGSAGPILNRLFQKAFQAAKAVRSSTAITVGQVSVANVAVELALTIFGNLADTRVLLVGAGDIGEKTAKAFLSRGAAALTVSSRTFTRAMELAQQLDASALPFENFSHHLADFDVIVCCTAALGTILEMEAVRLAMKQRPAQPLFLIDLALPRDIAPEVATLANVFLYNLDDLATIARHHLAARTAELARARALVAERTAALWRLLAESCPGVLPPEPAQAPNAPPPTAA